MALTRTQMFDCRKKVMKNRIFSGLQLSVRSKILWLVLLSTVLIFGSLDQATAQQRVLVSASKPDRVLVYELDSDTGLLALKNEVATSNAPGSFCFNEDGNRIYVSLKNPGSIAAYEFGQDSELTLIGEVDTGAYAGYVRAHKTGKFLFGSYYAAGQVTVHRILDGGGLSVDPIQKIKTDDNAHAVVSDPSGDFLFVPHTRPNKVFQFRIDSSNGELVANDPPYLIRNVNTGPRHLWFHPHLKVAYGSDEQGGSISTYAMSSEKGTLTHIDSLSSLPNGFSGSNSTSDIEVHSSGKFVYIANRGHNSIAAFAIDEANGSLSFVEHAAVDPVPRSFNITPKGDFLIAAGQQTNSLKVFRINESGGLSHTQTISIEGDPWWIVCQPR